MFHLRQVFVFWTLINKNVQEWFLLITCVKFLRTLILKNICVGLLLNWLYEVIVWNLISASHLKPFSKIPVSFKPELKKNLVYVPSIYLTPTLSCKPRFCMLIINGYYTNATACSPWNPCQKMQYCSVLFEYIGNIVDETVQPQHLN